MTQRPIDLKIPDIKAVRTLTRFLGKLHVPGCYYTYNDVEYQYDSNNHHIGQRVISKEGWGWGLKESKDYVEAKYEYIHPASPYNPLREIERGNMIHEIKRTRQLMFTLNKLGLVSPDSSLRLCKDFVTRMRR